MTNEEKQLLLKDLCGRLPYHPPVKIYNDSWEGCKIGEFDNNLYYHHVEAFVCDRIEIKPYLRPMSSMTEEERDELYTAMDWYGEIDENGNVYTHDQEKVYRETFYEYTDWLDKKGFDYRGLIPMGLALEKID